jgi:single-stranded DNA-specific DHH superfamily exonuclease
MKIDGINYLFMRKIDIYLEFSEILGDSKYSGLLINSYYNYDKLIPVLNSKYRAGDYEEIDKFYKTKKLNIFKRKVYTGSSTKEALKVGRNLNPNGKIRVMLIDKKFTGKKGAIASELTKNIDAPTVILIQDNPLSGSSRFLNGNILEFFKSNGDLFRTFGGHGKAVGFTIDNFKIPQFIEKFEAWFKHFDSKFEPKKLFYDDILEINKIGEAEKKLVKLCGPYGKQIQAPTYLDTNVIVKGIRRYGKDGRSLFLELEKGNTKVYGISPYNGTYANELDVNEKYNILYNPMLKKYEDSNVIYIVDIRKIG